MCKPERGNRERTRVGARNVIDVRNVTVSHTILTYMYVHAFLKRTRQMINLINVSPVALSWGAYVVSVATELLMITGVCTKTVFSTILLFSDVVDYVS